MLDKTFALLQFAENMGAWDDDPNFQAAIEEVKQLRSLPEVVVVMGSARFQQAFEEEPYRLALQGCIVLGKHVYKPGADWPLDERSKDLLHAVQFRKVDLASRVHVINVDGYIGQDTYNVIRYALKHERTVTFLEDRVQLLGHDGAVVTAAHFIQATRRRVEFDSAATD